MSASNFETVRPVEVAASTPIDSEARLDWDRDEHSIEFITSKGDVVRYSESEFRSSPERPHDALLLWSPSDLPLCLVGSQTALQLALLDKRDGSVRGRVVLPHLWDPGLRRVQVLADRSRLLIVTETGLICADDRGKTAWVRSDLQPDWHLVSVDPATIEYESELRGRWRYDLRDGTGDPPPRTG